MTAIKCQREIREEKEKINSSQIGYKNKGVRRMCERKTDREGERAKKKNRSIDKVTEEMENKALIP